MVREAFYWDFARGQVGGQASDSATDLRPLDDLFQREVNRLDELQAKPGALAVVPKSGVFKFGGGFGFGAERTGIGSVQIGMPLWDLLVVLQQQATIQLVDNGCTFVKPSLQRPPRVRSPTACASGVDR